jgi:multidrug efflux pump subunit AcrA (membrane-fusion protein)
VRWTCCRRCHPAATSRGVAPCTSTQAKPCQNVLTVPSSAVHTAGSTTYVLVPRDGRAVPQPVTVGAGDPVRTEITAGLRPGDRVVLAELASPSPTPQR